MKIFPLFTLLFTIITIKADDSFGIDFTRRYALNSPIANATPHYFTRTKKERVANRRKHNRRRRHQGNRAYPSTERTRKQRTQSRREMEVIHHTDVRF